MCGRFAFYSPAQAAVELFGVSADIDWEPHYNIAPTRDVLAVRCRDDGAREAVPLRWGLIPSWAKEKSIGNRMINARAETVAEKPAYRSAFRHRRCLVLADGFYEWRRSGTTKTPYYISLASGERLAFAGLWEHWVDRSTGEVIESTTVITAAANDFLAEIHDRMPMILTPSTAVDWLAGSSSMLEHIAEITPPLSAWPVNRRVNNARNEGADLVEPEATD